MARRRIGYMCRLRLLQSSCHFGSNRRSRRKGYWGRLQRVRLRSEGFTDQGLAGGDADGGADAVGGVREELINTLEGDEASATGRKYEGPPSRRVVGYCGHW